MCDKIPQLQYLKASFYVENKIPHISFYLEFQEESEITEIIKYHFETLNLLKTTLVSGTIKFYS